MRIISLLFFIVLHIEAFGQTDTGKLKFDYVVSKVDGDLNSDGLIDRVVVSQDTANDAGPYRLQIFFKDPSGQLKLKVTSLSIVLPQYPDGRDGMRTGDGFSDVTIKAGVLSVNYELLRGHFEHKFRFQHGNFELIGYSKVNSDGLGIMTTTDFNLSTGLRIEKSERYDTDETLGNKKQKVWIRPLPRIENMTPMANSLY